MLYDYLAMGGQEIVNSARAYSYASTANCPTSILQNVGCDTLDEALEAIGNGSDADGYRFGEIQRAPWFDPSLNDLSTRFMGVYGLTFDGFKDSTRRAEIVDRFSEGGVISRQTRAARVVTVRALLVAKGRDALDFGLEWLTAALDPSSCGQHGGRCGLTDMEFFDDCPPERGVDPDDPLLPEPIADYRSRVNERLRYLHDVAVTSGPLIVEERGTYDGWWVYEVEFTVGSEQAFIYSQTTDAAIRSDTSYIVQDQVENLILNPSTEQRGPLFALERNLIPNPSFETGTAPWVAFSAGGAVATMGRTDEFSVAGDWSGYVDLQVLGDGDGELPLNATFRPDSAYLAAGRTVPQGSLISLGLWLLLEVRAGDYTPGARYIQLSALSPSGSVPFTQTYDLEDLDILSGATFSAGLIAPAAFSSLLVNIIVSGTGEQSTTVPSDNTNIRLYLDAVHLTIPEA